MSVCCLFVLENFCIITVLKVCQNVEQLLSQNMRKSFCFRRLQVRPDSGSNPFTSTSVAVSRHQPLLIGQQSVANCKHFVPKNPAQIFYHFRVPIRSFSVKNPNKTGENVVPFFKMSCFTSQNGPFCSPEWFILNDEKGRFEVQNESFWKREKCKENTSRLLSVF